MRRGEDEKRGRERKKGMNVRFFINPDPPVKASPAARIELTLGMYIVVYWLFVDCSDGGSSSDVVVMIERETPTCRLPLTSYMNSAISFNDVVCRYMYVYRVGIS
jgi:hypothetical protein